MSRQTVDNNRPSALAWYYRRLRSMPLAEIPHRFVELIQRRTSKLPFRVARDSRVAEEILSQALPTLPLNLALSTSELTAPELQQLKDEVASLCAGDIELLGQRWPTGQMNDWAVDPESGNDWPWNQYTFDIPRRHGQGAGDIKYVWELSRLQHLQVLALGAHILHDDVARQRCLEVLESWLDGNPPYCGLGYASGIELASRLISILVAVTYLGPESIDQALRTKIWTSLIIHGRFIARFPSLYSSANNHLVAESAALCVLGSIVPDLAEASSWREIAWKRLEIEADRQVFPDGIGAEQSPTYLAYTLEWMLVAKQVIQGQDTARDSAVERALHRGARAISLLADSAGNVPFFGDCDGGVVLRPRIDETQYLSSTVCAIAANLGDASIMHPAFVSDMRAQMLSQKVLSAGSCELRNITFPDGGYTVVRDHSAGAEVFLLFDHGPLGFAETAAHGHADALAIWLHVDGKPVLVDFGTYRYFADRGFRAWARSTAAHNTIEVGGTSQSEATGPFNWGRRTSAQLLEPFEAEGSNACRASHSGYLNEFGVVHERMLAVADAGNLVITDQLNGTDKSDIRLSFHFAPEIEVAAINPQGSFEIRRDGTRIASLCIDCDGLQARLIRQESELHPGPGVVSERYGHLGASSSVVVTGRSDLPRTIESVLTIR
jgi:uncharacterized heparinase superfamily protein